MQQVWDLDCEVSFTRKQSGLGASNLLGQEGRRSHILPAASTWFGCYCQKTQQRVCSTALIILWTIQYPFLNPFLFKLTELFSVVIKEPRPIHSLIPQVYRGLLSSYLLWSDVIQFSTSHITDFVLQAPVFSSQLQFHLLEGKDHTLRLLVPSSAQHSAGSTLWIDRMTI